MNNDNVLFNLLLTKYLLNIKIRIEFSVRYILILKLWLLHLSLQCRTVIIYRPIFYSCQCTFDSVHIYFWQTSEMVCLNPKNTLKTTERNNHCNSVGSKIWFFFKIIHSKIINNYFIYRSWNCWSTPAVTSKAIVCE